MQEVEIMLYKLCKHVCVRVGYLFGNDSKFRDTAPVLTSEWMFSSAEYDSTAFY